MRDPIGELTHDHGHLSALVVAVATLLARVEAGEDPCSLHEELRDAAEGLHDALLVHFAREEEALFPFIEKELGTVAESAEALRRDHDAVCASARDLVRAVVRTAQDGFIVVIEAATRFQELYASHAQAELALLKSTDENLDDAKRAKLRDLLETL